MRLQRREGRNYNGSFPVMGPNVGIRIPRAVALSSLEPNNISARSGTPSVGHVGHLGAWCWSRPVDTKLLCDQFQ